MNNRINEIAAQCGFRPNPDIYDRNQSFDIPKFAELIIAESVQFLSDAGCEFEAEQLQEFWSEE